MLGVVERVEEEKRKRASFLWVEKAAEETQGQTLETQKMLENTGKKDGKNDRCWVWWRGWRRKRGKDVGCGGGGGGRKEEKGFFLVGGEGGGGNRWERGRHGNKGKFSLRALNSNS